MSIQNIRVDLIDVPAGRRVRDPDFVAALAEDFKVNGHKDPIEVIHVGERYRLVIGGHRLDAKKLLGEETIKADVKQPSEYASDAAIKLAEIAENFKRRELTVLDRAFDVAAWREIFEAATGAIKPGKKAISRKLATNSDEELGTLSEQFAGTFSASAQKALKLSRDAVFRSLKIASMSQRLRERISLHPLADNQSELLAFAAEPALRQEAIVGLLLAEPPAAKTVADAISIIDKVPTVRVEAWAKVSDKFSKLPDPAKRLFILEHWDFVEAILAERKAA